MSEVHTRYTQIRFQRDNLFHYFSLIKSSESEFFLPKFSLIMWLMKVQTNVKKVAIFRICEQVSF